MGGGLEIYATARRFFGRKGDRMIGIHYAEIAEARRRVSHWKTWQGISRIILGVGFAGAGALTGFESPPATIISLSLSLIGAAFLLLGIFRRDDWVELKIQRKEPPPSFWYIVVFLPFWLMLQSRKRYRVPGSREEVDAFHEYLAGKRKS